MIQTSTGQLRSTSPVAAAVAVGVGLFAFSTCLSVTPPALVEIAREMKLSAGQIGRLSAFTFFPLVLTVALGGYLSLFMAKGRLVVAGCWGLLAGSVILANSHSFAMLCVGVCVLGLTAGLIESTANALLGQLFRGPARTAVMNYAHVAFALAAIGVPIAMAIILRARMDWRIGYWIAAVIGLLSALGILGTGTHRLGEPEAAHVVAGRAIDPFSLALIVAMFCYVATETAICFWLPIHFTKVLSAPVGLAAASNAAFWSGAVIGRIGAGLSGRYVKDVTLLRVSSILGVCSMLVFSRLRSAETALAMVGIVGLTFACIWPTIVSYAGHVYNARLTVTLPWIVGAGAAGAAIGPWIVGEVAAHPGAGLATAFMVNPLLFVVVTLIVLIAPTLEKRARRPVGDI
ncbi:MAG: MFS transporter [Armatimonadetes bacterium]|nr:MFS transporter [Armatimonadota bacterium]